jgi:hypothetical protein
MNLTNATLLNSDFRNHQLWHRELHRQLGDLVADFIVCNGKLPSKTTVMELMQWSAEQGKNPAIPGLQKVATRTKRKTKLDFLKKHL